MPVDGFDYIPSPDPPWVGAHPLGHCGSWLHGGGSVSICSHNVPLL